MADLAHHLGRVGAEGDQDRGEGVAQLVGGETLRQGQLAALAKQLIGALEDLRQDALSQVAAVAPAPGPGREGEGVGGTSRGTRFVGGEDVVERHRGAPDRDPVRRRRSREIRPRVAAIREGGEFACARP